MDTNPKVIPLPLHPLGLVECFTAHGANIDALLADTGITRGMLETDGVRISYRQQVRLIRNGIRLCDEPGIGLLAGMRFDWIYHGAVGQVVHCSPSLSAAVRAFVRYLPAAQPLYGWWAGKSLGYVDRNGVFIHPVRRLTWPSAPPDLVLFDQEFALATVLRLAAMCGNHQVANPSVHVRVGYAAPAHAHLYDTLPCDSLSFGHGETHVCAHYAFVTEPFRAMRKPHFQRVLDQCEDELRRNGITLSCTDQVRTYLTSLDYSRHASRDDVAEALQMTPRMLTRRLAMENTSFRDILRDVRMDLTLQHLRSSRLSVEQIAQLMGFSCGASLHRAVKNATGLTVGGFRGRTSPQSA